MDQDQLNQGLQQLEQLSQPHHPQQQQQQQHYQHHQHHQSLYQPPPQLQSEVQLQQQQQQQQHLDSTPQDVLAEARKNLQLLIDNGLTKDFLHHWVDNDLSQQLSFPCQQQSLSQPFASAVSPTSSVSPSPLPSPLLTQTPSHPQTQLQSSSHSHGAILSSPLQQSLPTLPQVAASAVPAVAHVSPATTASGLSTAATSPIGTSSSSTLPPPTIEASPATAIAPAIVIKSEPYGETGAWATPLPQAPSHAPAPQLQPVTSAQDPSYNGLLNHRPRISVSSISSMSSGHGSVWSVNSGHSNVSWPSTSSSRSMAPLPMPPPMTSTSSAPLLNNPPSAVANKQNIYWCTSCETSFKRKYDWKRHEDEFHERWRKYPCPEPGCNRSFWGSNSFNQHHKQCHGCKTCPHAEKVVKQLRKRKYWACGFCSALHPARERHVEHVARHFESGLTKSDWMHSRVIYGLLHQPLIHAAWDALVANKHGDSTARRPQFSWHPNKTGRAQGFLEKECPGQLQDRLEFFSGEERDVHWIVTMAYDLADVVLATPPSPSQPQPPSGVTSQQFMPSGMAPPGSFSPQNDRMSFPPAQPVPSPASQQGIVASPISNAPSSFSSSPYQSQIYVPSPGFASMQQSSPETMAHSPFVASQPHLEESELPPIPLEVNNGSAVGSGMMDFEYSPAVIFEDWQAVSGGNLVSPSHLHGQQQQEQQHQIPSPNEAAQAQWGLSQFFSNPHAPI